MSEVAVGGGRDRPEGKLTPVERKQVSRLFSDPTYFPPEFRVWLKEFIQNAGITVTASQIVGSNTIRTGLPPGIFISCGAAGAVPPDALACDGRAVSRTTYNLLFGKIGTTWGAGDGAATFNLPDMRDRSPFGAGAAVGAGATDGQAYGSRGGPRHSTSRGGGVTKSGTVSGSLPTNPQGFNPNPSTGSAGAASGDRSLQQAALSIVDGITVSENITVGPPGLLADAPNWAGVVYAITTGQTA